MPEVLIDSEDYLELLTELTEAAITGLTSRAGKMDPGALADQAVAIATRAAHAILARVAEVEDVEEEDEEEEEGESEAATEG